jgi:hypothetical protein
MAKKSNKTIARSAKSGKFVKKQYADKHPATTVKERVKKGGSSTGGTGPRRK